MPDFSTHDLIAIGELLIDLISTDYADDLRQAETYKRIPGGSPANLAGNLARLGKKVGLVASVGEDAAGTYLHGFVSELGLDASRVRRVPEPSTLILVTKSKEVSAFTAYRAADAQIILGANDLTWIAQSRIIHTTAFALSQEPAQSSILRAVAHAAKAGRKMSIDANYAPEIWPDRQQAQRIIGEYLSHGALAKFSEVDYHRLFGEKVDDPQLAAQRILNLGADLVCLTLGEGGVFVLTADESFHLPSRKIEVKDTTGAGDAFWAGFLSAYLDELPLLACAKAGRALAEMKLGIFGPLPPRVEVSEIYH